MKEYNWREERQKYQADFNKTSQAESPQSVSAPQNVTPVTNNVLPETQPVRRPVPRTSPWRKILGVIVVLAALIIIAVLENSDDGKTAEPSPSPDSQENPSVPEDSVKIIEQSVKSGSYQDFESVLEKIKYNVGVVCIRMAVGDEEAKLTPLGTVWAMAPNKFATNGHVAQALHTELPMFLRNRALLKMLTQYKVDKVGDLPIAVAKVQLAKDQETAQRLVLTGLLQKHQCADKAQLIAKITQEEFDKLMESGVTEYIVKKYEQKDLDSTIQYVVEKTWTAECDKLVAALDAKTAFSVVILMNSQPQVVYNVVAVQAHPLYRNAKSPDVAVLTIREKTPHYFKIASKEKLRNLKQGRKIGYLGFPMENLDNDNINLASPVATFQSGEIIALSDFELKEVVPAQAYWIRHNLPCSGGASGSPIFDLDGEVIALHNSVLGFNDKIYEALNSRVESGAQVNGAIRADLLEGVSEPVAIDRWMKEGK